MESIAGMDQAQGQDQGQAQGQAQGQDHGQDQDQQRAAVDDLVSTRGAGFGVGDDKDWTSQWVSVSSPSYRPGSPEGGASAHGSFNLGGGGALARVSGALARVSGGVRLFTHNTVLFALNLRLELRKCALFIGRER